jgi:hypothetical protein
MDTPETDAATEIGMRTDTIETVSFVTADFARKLERQRNELQAQLEATAVYDEGILRQRDALHSMLFDFHEAFNNRWETSSLHDWNKRMKSVDDRASKFLEPAALAKL